MSEDNIFFQAHKVIIATASIVIRELIANNTGPDHFVHFGVSSIIMQDILKFIYTGKCTVPKTHIDQFIKEAKNLQIQGIDGQKEINPKEESINSADTNKHKQDKNETCQQENGSYELSEEDTYSPMLLEYVAEKIPKDFTIKSSTVQDTKITHINTGQEIEHVTRGVCICSECGYQTRDNYNLSRHIQGQVCSKDKKPLNSVYYCELCDYRSTDRRNYKIHTETHGDAKYFCDVTACDYKSVRNLDVKKHKQMVHFREYITCETCGFVTHSKKYLKVHIQTKHEGKLFFCDDCEKSYHSELSLRRHRERKHIRTVFRCDYTNCGYKTIMKQGQKEHMEMVHAGSNYRCGIQECNYISSRYQHVTDHRIKKHQNLYANIMSEKLNYKNGKRAKSLKKFPKLC